MTGLLELVDYSDRSGYFDCPWRCRVLPYAYNPTLLASWASVNNANLDIIQ